MFGVVLLVRYPLYLSFSRWGKLDESLIRGIVKSYPTAHLNETFHFPAALPYDFLINLHEQHEMLDFFLSSKPQGKFCFSYSSHSKEKLIGLDHPLLTPSTYWPTVDHPQWISTDGTTVVSLYPNIGFIRSSYPQYFTINQSPIITSDNQQFAVIIKHQHSPITIKNHELSSSVTNYLRLPTNQKNTISAICYIVTHHFAITKPRQYHTIQLIIMQLSVNKFV